MKLKLEQQRKIRTAKLMKKTGTESERMKKLEIVCRKHARKTTWNSMTTWDASEACYWYQYSCDDAVSKYLVQL